MPQGPLPAGEVRAVLLILPNWVGDVVMATPAVREVRARFPGARVVAYCRPYVRKILEDSPRIDAFILEARRGPLGLPARETLRALRAERFDLAVVFTHSFRTGLLARLSGARRRVGYDRGGRGWMLTDRVPPLPKERNARGKRRIRPENMVEHYLKLVRPLGCPGAETREELFFGPEAEEAVEKALSARGVDGAKPLVGVNPGASFGSSKMWGAERFAALADRLAAPPEAGGLGAETLFFCGPGEEPILEDIRGRMKARAHFIAPAEATLATLKGFVARLDLLITNDTGPRHYAVALGKPAVVIMGPTDPRYTEVNMERTRVLRREVPCGPCHLKTCPIDHRCMTEIAPEEVLEAARRALASARGDDPR